MASAADTDHCLVTTTMQVFVCEMEWSYKEWMIILMLQHNSKMIHILLPNILLPMWNLNLLQLVPVIVLTVCMDSEGVGGRKAKQNRLTTASGRRLSRLCPSRQLCSLLLQNCGFVFCHLQWDCCFSAEDVGLVFFFGHCSTEGNV